MSTRGVYSFIDEDFTGHVEYHVYKHSDNYPDGEHGGICAIQKALEFSWHLPRYEADEFAASFVAANKDGGGGVRLLTGGDPKVHGRNTFPGDIEYHYVVSCKNGVLQIECRHPPSEDGTKLGKLVKRGSLAAMLIWAMRNEKAQKVAAPVKSVIVAVNQSGDHKTGSLPSNITPAQIVKVLGFKANVDDDKSKVKYSWGFTVDGKRAGIWDYKGSRWSVFDPAGVVPDLFLSLV